MNDFIQDEIFEELIEEAVEYSVVFGGAFLLLWVLAKPLLRHRKIQETQRAGPRQWLDEVWWSLVAAVGSTLLGLSLLWTETVSPVVDLSTSPWFVGALGFFAMLFASDAWFYWFHRWLHTNRWAYRKVHLIHHGSKDVTPLAGQRFHPVELFLIPLPNAILPMVFLLDERWYVAGFVFSLLNNIYAHGGFELLPTFWEKLPILRYKTTSLHHNMHHDRVRGNYALYFTWWDRWMGTEFDDCAEVRSELNERIKRTNRSGQRRSTGPAMAGAGSLLGDDETL